jgi:hypothetical protein
VDIPHGISLVSLVPTELVAMTIGKITAILAHAILAQRFSSLSWQRRIASQSSAKRLSIHSASSMRIYSARFLLAKISG